jgi:hypothetical protein
VRSVRGVMVLLMASAVATISSSARAQGRPFAFNVPWPDEVSQKFVARYDAGYGERTFEPLAADRVEQAIELDVPVGGRVLILGSTGVALNGPAAVRGLGQIEAMVDIFRFSGWHLGASGGVRRQFDGSTMLLSRVSISRTASTWSFVAHGLVGTTVAGGDAGDHDNADLSASLGATAQVIPWLGLGVETVAADLEGLWQKDEAEGGSTIFAGPLMTFTLPKHVARITLSGGPIVRTTGNGIPAYAATPGGESMPISTHRMGYLLRTAVSVGL